MLLVAALATAMDEAGVVAAITETVGLGGTRADAVVAYAKYARPPPIDAHRLSGLAALIHRVAPGVRLM